MTVKQTKLLHRLNRQFDQLAKTKAQLIEARGCVDLFTTAEYKQFAAKYRECCEVTATDTTVNDAVELFDKLLVFVDSTLMNFAPHNSDFILAARRYSKMLDPVAKTLIDNTVRTQHG